jgi:hypothetical protein
MPQPTLSRRRFHRLTGAAVGGLAAGTLAGCAAGDRTVSAARPVGMPGAAEPHVCRGLNACKGRGAAGRNTCAGQGACATAKHHACKGMNECKGQGGCGESLGANACKGQGACAVPLTDDKWKKARAAFEAKMKSAGKPFGPAPNKS